jgi:glycosyltransferase involved in cell wall biosynthesis
MQKIALFTQNLDVGGVQKWVTNIANFLSKFYKVYIILAEDNKDIKFKLNTKIEIIEIKTKKIDITKKHIGKMIFNYRVKELEKILNKIKVKVVFAFEEYNNRILLSAKVNVIKIVSIRISFNAYKNKKVHLLEEEFYKKSRKLYKKAKKIIAVSQTIKKELQKGIVIYNGIKIREYKEQRFSNYILNVGRLHSQKGQIDLIKAFYEIKDKIKEDLIIVGDGVLKEELNNLIKELKLENRIKLVGYDDPYKYYKNANLFVFPSYFEGHPNALLEAMKCGCAVISYDFQGSEEILDKRVKVGDIASLSKEILKILKDKKLKEELKQKSKEIIKKYNYYKTLKKYKRVVDICIKHHF